MSVFLERVFQHGPNIIIHCRRAEEILIRVKKPPYEHAVASIAERLRPNRHNTHILEWGPHTAELRSNRTAEGALHNLFNLLGRDQIELA